MGYFKIWVGGIVGARLTACSTGSGAERWVQWSCDHWAIFAPVYMPIGILNITLHRSHFGSRYTLGYCGHAGLALWGSIPLSCIPKLCLLACDGGPPPLEAEHAESSYLATVRPQASVVTHLQHDFGFFNYFRAVCRSFFFTIMICGLGLWPKSTTASPVS